MGKETENTDPLRAKYNLFNRSDMVDSEGKLITHGRFEEYSWFRTKGVRIGDLGVAVLWESKDLDQEAENAAYFENGSTILFDDSTELDRKGYFRLSVHILGTLPEPLIMCRVILPDQVALISSLEHDEDPNAVDPLNKQTSISYLWKIRRGDDMTSCRFYDIGNPDFLSQLEFEFFASQPRVTTRINSR